MNATTKGIVPYIEDDPRNPPKPDLPPDGHRNARKPDDLVPEDYGPGEPIPLLPEMAAWATANAQLIWPMPGPDDGVDEYKVVEWVSSTKRYRALPLPGGNIIPATRTPSPAATPPPPPHLSRPIDFAPLFARLRDDVREPLLAIAAELRQPLQTIADLKTAKQWLTARGFIGSFLLRDPSTARPVASRSTFFSWRGTAADHFVSGFDDLLVIVDRIAGGLPVREVLIALSNFAEEHGVIPERHMGLADGRSLEQWRHALDHDLRDHLLAGGTVYIQVILRKPQHLPPPTPPQCSQIAWNP